MSTTGISLTLKENATFPKLFNTGSLGLINWHFVRHPGHRDRCNRATCNKVNCPLHGCSIRKKCQLATIVSSGLLKNWGVRWFRGRLRRCG